MVQRSKLGGSDRFVVDNIEVEVDMLNGEFVNITEAFDEDGCSVSLGYETKVRMELEIEDFLRDEY